MLIKKVFFSGISASERIFSYNIYASRYKYIFGIFKIAFFKGQYYFETSNKKPIIFDCWANIGVTSLYFDYLYPQAQIHTFEPNQEVFGYLTKNTRDNPNIHNHNIALSNTEGKLDFFVNNNDIWDTNSSLNHKTNAVLADTVQVDVVKLSDFMKKHLPGKRIDFIKFNIEWSEDRVIEDLAANDCLQYIDRMIFEYHHHIEVGEWSHLAAMLKRLEDAGMNYTFSVTNFRLYKEDITQNLFIHAYRKPAK